MSHTRAIYTRKNKTRLVRSVPKVELILYSRAGPFTSAHVVRGVATCMHGAHVRTWKSRAQKRYKINKEEENKKGNSKKKSKYLKMISLTAQLVWRNSFNSGCFCEIQGLFFSFALKCRFPEKRSNSFSGLNFEWHISIEKGGRRFD